MLKRQDKREVDSGAFVCSVCNRAKPCLPESYLKFALQDIEIFQQPYGTLVNNIALASALEHSSPLLPGTGIKR